MALPVGPEDLQKLKSFIDFVSTNPKILNFPQLEFVKNFIEKFGGKVPTGEYKMPDGGSCPFGSGVKPESSKPREQATEQEPEETEMESELESDLELDMEVTTAAEKDRDVDSHIPNAVYLQDSKARHKNIKGNESMYFSSTEETNFIEHKTKGGETSSENEAYDMDMDYESCDESDPIDTAAEVIIKTESDFESLGKLMDDADSDDSDVQISRIKQIKKRKVQTERRNTRSSKLLKHSDDKDFWASVSGYKKKRKQPKPVNCTDKCRHKCHLQQISEVQRKTMCAEYWALSKADRKNYLLNYVESLHISKIRAKRSNRPSRGYTNAYFLKNKEGKRVRVCLNYFQRTFCISNNVIKMATQNRDPKEIKKVGKIKKTTSNTSEEKGENTDDKRENNSRDGDGTITNDEVVSNVSTEQLLPQPDEREPQGLNASADDSSTKKHGKRHNITTNKGKKIKKERVPQRVNCDERCIMKCTQNFTAEQRAQICQHFWTMDYKRQKDFVLSKIETRDVESLTAKEYRTSTRAQRTFSNRYYFKGPRGNNVRVCANFFMATLCIGRHVINNALQYADRQTGSYAGEDRRGKHTPGNKIPDELVQDMKRYIESHPTWVPHKNYKTKFLHSSLSIQQMWRDYKQIREAGGHKYCSASFFRQIFHKDYRLAFLKPASKHAQRVNAMKKDVFLPKSLSKKLNTNISEFTGEEGGFWIKPNGTETDQIPSATHTKSDGVVNESEEKQNTLLHIEKDEQHQASQESLLAESSALSATYFSESDCSSPISSNGHQIHGIPSSNIYNTRHDEEQPEETEVFRML